MNKREHTISFQRDGVIITKRLATVDHVIPLGEGGGNSLLNLVPSCYPCNEGRNREAQLRETAITKASFKRAALVPAREIKKLRVK